MVCTTLTVSTPVPVVSVVPNTTGFAMDNSQLTSCSLTALDIAGKTIQIISQITVTNATARFRITANWNKDGVAQSSTALQIGNVGTAYYNLLTGISYASGSYTGLTVTVSEVSAY